VKLFSARAYATRWRLNRDQFATLSLQAGRDRGLFLALLGIAMTI